MWDFECITSTLPRKKVLSCQGHSCGFRSRFLISSRQTNSGNTTPKWKLEMPDQIEFCLFSKSKYVNLKTQARAAGRGQSDSPAAPLPAAVLCQFNGIPAMSAITGGLGKPTKGFGALLEESRESRRCRSGEKRRWNKNSKSWRCSRCGWLVFKEDKLRLSGAFSA